MATTNGVLPPGLDHLRLKSEQAKPKDDLSQSEFLKLMLTQIKHQDPLKPMEGGEFLSQLAQFGTINGIAKLQSSFDLFASSLQSNQALQASTMVGRTVLVPGNVAALEAGDSVQGAVDVPASTGDLVITISDMSGQQVKQINMGAQQAGIAHFTWDGFDESGAAVDAGLYQITAQATVDGEVISQSTLIQSKVESVTLTQNGEPPLLNLQGLGAVSMNDVKEVM